LFIKSWHLVGPNETIRPEVTAQFFPRCDLYSAPSTEYRYIKYAVCKLNLKISPDPEPNPNPKPIHYPYPTVSLTLCHSRLVFRMTIKSHLGKNCAVTSCLMVSLEPTKYRLLTNHFSFKLHV